MSNVKELLKKEFFNYLDNSIRVTSDKYPDYIFWIYDNQLIRDRKISNLLDDGDNSNKNMNYIDYKESVIFEQNLKNKDFWIKNSTIWSVFGSKLSMNYEQIQSFFKDLLKEHDELKELTPKRPLLLIFNNLKEHDELKELTPNTFKD